MKSLKNRHRRAYANKAYMQPIRVTRCSWQRQCKTTGVWRSRLNGSSCYNSRLSRLKRLWTWRVIVGAREMGRSISKAFIEYVFAQTTISRMYRKYQVSGKTLNIRQRCGRKKRLWNVRTVDDWEEWYNEIDMQQFLKILWSSVLEHQQVSVWDLFNRPSFIWFSETPAYSCTHVDYTAQSFTPRMDPSIRPLHYWWLHTGCLSVHTRTPIHVHCAFGRTWIILSAHCYIPHDESWHQGAPRAFSWL